MKKSLSDQLYTFIQAQTEPVAGAQLSRYEWSKYAYGEKRGTHSPRAVIRRLQELTEEGKLVVSYKNGIAYYSTKEKAAYPKKVYWQDKVFEIKNAQEEAKFRAFTSQKASMGAMQANHPQTV